MHTPILLAITLILQLIPLWALPTDPNSFDPEMYTIAPISTDIQIKLRKADVKTDVDTQIKSFREALQHGWSDKVHKTIVAVVYTGRESEIGDEGNVPRIAWDVTRRIYDVMTIVEKNSEENRSKEQKDLLKYLSYPKNLPYFETTLRGKFYQLSTTFHVSSYHTIKDIQTSLEGKQNVPMEWDYSWAVDLLEFAIIGRKGDKDVKREAIAYIKEAFQHRLRGPLQDLLESLLREMVPH
ncbi:hypothetical protein H0H93_008279 [Arthromyces matolae]|nr:hypothetical protein H0H93_008279 [Arthromyces matolae]